MLHIQRHEYSRPINFGILFLDILPWYFINLDVASLFVDSSSIFLMLLNDLLYQFERMNKYCFAFIKKTILIVVN